MVMLEKSPSFIELQVFMDEFASEKLDDKRWTMSWIITEAWCIVHGHSVCYFTYSCVCWKFSFHFSWDDIKNSHLLKYDSWFNFIVTRECNTYISTQKHTPHIFSLYNVEHIYVHTRICIIYVRYILLYGLMYSILRSVSCVLRNLSSINIKLRLVVQNIHIL